MAEPIIALDFEEWRGKSPIESVYGILGGSKRIGGWGF